MKIPKGYRAEVSNKKQEIHLNILIVSYVR